MSAEQRLVIEHACARLALEYARAIDFRDYDNFVELFAADAVLDVDVPLHGRRPSSNGSCAGRTRSDRGT